MQAKLDKIKHKEEELNELKKRVNKQKHSLDKKENYFLENHKKHKAKEENEKLEDKETTEDQDLIVDDCEEDDDESHDEEHNLNDNEDNFTKVNPYFV